MTISYMLRKIVWGLAASLIFGATVLASSEEAKQNPSIDQAISSLARECIATLKSKGATKVAMTYIFHNGSSETAVSNFTKRLLTAHLLREAGRDIALIDRQDFQLQHKEDGFAFIFSTGNGKFSQPVPVDAILVGELITSPACRTMVLCLKAIDPKTSRILSAPVASMSLSKDFAARLGISELDLEGLPTLPQPSGDTKMWASDLSAAFDIKQITCSLDDPGNVGVAMALNSRLLRAYLTSSLVSAKWSLLEREMFFIVAKDQAASGVESSSFPVGEVILRLESDNTATQVSPSCFAKAIQMKDGRLLGQTHVALAGSVAGTQSGSGIGGDQALAEALRKIQANLAPSKEDSLVFSSSVILANDFKPSNELKSFASEHPNANYIDLLWIRESSFEYRQFWGMPEPEKGHWERGLEAKKYSERTIFQLNAIEKGDLNAIKADIICALVWGYAYHYEGDPRNEGFIHLGPLIDVVRQISSRYSLNRDGSDSTVEWLRWFSFGARYNPGSVSNTFSERLYQSLHPTYRSLFDDPYGKRMWKDSFKPLTFPAGTFRNIPYRSDSPSIHFNYGIETVWKDVFPSNVKVTIDLTPMKDSIYKINK